MGFEHSINGEGIIDANENIIASSNESATESELKKVNRGKSKLDKIKETPSGLVFIAQGDLGLVWINIAAFATGHIISAWFVCHVLLYSSVSRITGALICNTAYSGFLAGLGVTAGAHRLWSHKSYKAKLPLRIFLMILQTVAGQNCLYIWCRDHRVHHKYSETDADPHNTNRGFFFA